MTTLSSNWCKKCNENPYFPLADIAARQVAHQQGHVIPGNGHFKDNHAMVLYGHNASKYLLKNSYGSQTGKMEIDKHRHSTDQIYGDIYFDDTKSELFHVDPSYNNATVFIGSGYFIEINF